uniref:Large ribosomal subunit protein uL4c n=1 Tax=Pterocladia lucida TaxID=31408 RepID=A0A6M3WW64_PTELU|nr:ribosomal protein L4 [Pterocladia lucida]
MIKYKSIIYPITSIENSEKDTYEIRLKVSDSEEQAMYSIHKALTIQLNNRRQGTAHTKKRSDVRGGGRKPWKQKGTGRARAGSSRSPLWRGGGIIFGPQTRYQNHKINKKEKKLALRNLIYNKNKQTIVTNNFNEQLNKPSTKKIIKKLNELGIKDNKEKVLIITNNKQYNLYLSIRNLTNVELIESQQLNILSIIKADRLVIDIQTLKKINDTYN